MRLAASLQRAGSAINKKELLWACAGKVFKFDGRQQAVSVTCHFLWTLHDSASHSKKSRLNVFVRLSAMLRQIPTILTIFMFIQASAQLESLPPVKKISPKDTTQDWYLTILKSSYSDFIVMSEHSVWSWQDHINALAIRNDSAFVVTITRIMYDNSTSLTSNKIDQADFNQIVDTLKHLNFFSLKDEKDVVRCEKQIKERVNGKLVTLTTSTAYITDGVTTDFSIYSNSALRFVSYYRLDNVKEICPGSQIWKNVLHIRNFFDQTFDKYGR